MQYVALIKQNKLFFNGMSLEVGFMC